MNLITKIKGKEFRKSTFSGESHKCVGVSITKNDVSIVNTNTKKEIVSFTHDEWKAFIKGAKNNEFDI